MGISIRLNRKATVCFTYVKQAKRQLDRICLFTNVSDGAAPMLFTYIKRTLGYTPT